MPNSLPYLDFVEGCIVSYTFFYYLIGDVKYYLLFGTFLAFEFTREIGLSQSADQNVSSKSHRILFAESAGLLHGPRRNVVAQIDFGCYGISLSS